MVTVSIITPTYNRKQLICDTIDSVLLQTFSDYELIIIDDGSSDGTGEHIKARYKDPRIRYFYQENKGQNFARNHGLRHAKGEYISFLDSDDLWPADKLSRSLQAFEQHPEVDVVYGDEMVIDEQGNEIGKESMPRYSGRVSAKLIAENFIGMSAAMVKADRVKKIGGMDESISVADDYSLWLRLSSECVFYYINDTLGYYRLTADQISKNLSARLDANLFIVTDFLQQYPDAVSESEKRTALCQFYSKRVRTLGACGRYRQGIKEFAKALWYNPKSLLPWRSLYRLMFPHT